MSLFDVTRYNDTIEGLKTSQCEDGDVRTTYTPGNSGEPVLSINFSNMARRVLSAFGLEEPPMEKYAVPDVKALQEQELKDVRAEIQTLDANAVGLTKEASARLERLRTREEELVSSIA
jgi:hypothetical protein